MTGFLQVGINEREVTTDLKDRTNDKPRGLPLHTRIVIGLLTVALVVFVEQSQRRFETQSCREDPVDHDSVQGSGDAIAI